MRIFGKQHDYYDSALAHGHDDRVIFHRNKESVPYNVAVHGQFYRALRISNIRNKELTLDVEPFSVCFCGKLYKGLELTTQTFGYPVTVKSIFYDYAEALAFLKENDLVATGADRQRFVQQLTEKQLGHIEQYFALNGSDAPLQYMIDNKCPIMTIKYATHPDFTTVVSLNGTLKELEFYRVMDAYTAYQELDMFVGGVLTQSDKMVDTVADKDRIAQHGFDKHSFRKMPEK